MLEVALWIYPIQFARSEQRVQQRAALTTMVRAEEQEVFTTQTNHPQGIFSNVVICFSPAVICIIRQGRPLVQHIRERFCQF